MALNKLMPAALVLLALAGSATAQTCTTWTGATSLTGSTTKINTLHFWNNGLRLPKSEVCNWEITCPAGSFIGVVNMQWGGFSETDSKLTFTDNTDSTNPKVAQEFGAAWRQTSFTYYDRKFLMPGVNKLKIDYQATSLTGSFDYAPKGFILNYKCFTTQCPKEMFTPKISTMASNSGFALPHMPVIPGLADCTFTFSCANAADRPVLSWQYGQDQNNAAGMGVWVNDGTTNYTVQAVGTSYGSYKLAAASSYTVGVDGPIGQPLALDYTSTYRGGSNLNYKFVWASCQAATETSCKSASAKSGATLTAAFGSITSQSMYPAGASSSRNSYSNLNVAQSCVYTITCPSGSSGILLSSRTARYTTWTVKSSSTSSTTLKSFTGTSSFSTTSGTYNSTLTSLYVTLTTTTTTTRGGELTYSCYSQTCSGPDSGRSLGGNAMNLSTTEEKLNTVVPMTTDSYTFKTDNDGQFSSYKTTSFQSCMYSVNCPTGYYVMLNVSGYQVNGDRVFGTSGSQSFDWSTVRSSTSWYAVDSSVILKSNTASWTMVANPLYYRSTFGTTYNSAIGYNVEAGCTSMMPGTCPWSSAGTHFSSLATATVGTGVVLNTRLNSYLSGTMPIGVNCSFPVSCPTGTYIQVAQGAGVQVSTAYPTAPNAPKWAAADGSAIYTDNTVGYVNLGVGSATLKFAPTMWNTTSPGQMQTGFWMNVSCTASSTAAPPPTPSPLTPVPFTPFPASSSATCSPWASKSTTLMGSLNSINTDLVQYNTLLSGRISNDRCGWTLKCPAGQMVGVTDFRFQLNTGDIIEFVDVAGNGWKTLDTYSRNSPYIGSGTRYGRQALYHTNMVRVLYNTSSSAGYGLIVKFSCYDTKCPADLVKATKYSTASATGITFLGATVPGIDCSWDVACPVATDKLAISMARGTAAVANFTVDGGASASRWTLPLSSVKGTRRLDAATSGYKITMRTPMMASASTDSGSSYLSTTGRSRLGVVVSCQPSSDSTCYNIYKTGSTLTAQGTLNTDVDGINSFAYSTAGESCKYDVSCNAGSTLTFNGNNGYSTSSSDPAIQVFNDATNTTAAHTVGYSFSSTGTKYSHPSNTAVLQFLATSGGSRGGWVSWKCANSACTASAQAGLYDTTVPIPNTGMAKSLIPQLAASARFHSDEDGASVWKTHPSTSPADSCKFGVSCPTGYNVIFNVSGSFARTSAGLKDEVSTTIGSTTYKVTTTRTTAGTSTRTASMVTNVNSLTWTQKAHYISSTTRAYGYTVSAGCTTFTRNTCPFSDEATKFDSLKTAALGTKVVFDTYSNYGYPEGVKCDWKVTCPSGSFVKFSPAKVYSQYTGLSSSNPDAPLFNPSTGTAINFNQYSDTATGANSGSISWGISAFEASSSGWVKGFNGSVYCDATAPTTPTPPQPITITFGTGSGNSSTSNAFATPTLVACPYSTTTYELTEGTRHALQFDFASVSATLQYTVCTFAFKCPSTSTGMAVKASKNPNADVVDGGISIFLNDTKEFTFVSSSRDANVVTPKNEFTAIMTGRADAADMLISCLTTNKVPSTGSLVNYDQVSPQQYYYGSSSLVNAYAVGTYGYNNSKTVSVNYRFDKSYSLAAARRRSYSTSNERAYLLSCHNRNMSSVINVVQLISISGQTGSAGDQLVVYALDSNQNKTYGGVNATINQTWTRSSDRTQFEASTQYYVTWSTDSTADDSSYNGPVIKFMCGESADTFTVAGVGETVANSLGNGASAPMTLLAAALAALLVLLA